MIKIDKTKLTAHQVTVLELLIGGLSTDDMQEVLQITHGGLKYHLTNLYRIHKVKNKTQLKQLFEPPPEPRGEPLNERLIEGLRSEPRTSV